MSIVIDPDNGVQMPSLTTVDKDLIASPVAGAIVFDTTLGKLSVYTGVSWEDTAAGGFPSGTKMLFQQTAAPTGWTKDTTAAINDSILRFVTGSVTPSGGSVAFSAWNAQTGVGATTLSTAQMPAHTHLLGAPNNVAGLQGGSQGKVGSTAGNSATGSTGGGGSHTHTLTHGVKYYDAIIASKD